MHYNFCCFFIYNFHALPPVNITHSRYMCTLLQQTVTYVSEVKQSFCLICTVSPPRSLTGVHQTTDMLVLPVQRKLNLTISARERLHFTCVVTDCQLVLCHAIQTALSLTVIKTEVAHWAHTHYTEYSHHSSSDCLITICKHKHFSHYI